jgi:hypothetical protein
LSALLGFEFFEDGQQSGGLGLAPASGRVIYESLFGLFRFQGDALADLSMLCDSHPAPPFRLSQAMTSSAMNRRDLPMNTQGIPDACKLSIVRRLQSSVSASPFRLRSGLVWPVSASWLSAMINPSQSRQIITGGTARSKWRHG